MLDSGAEIRNGREQLAHALLAHRNRVSIVTGYAAFFLFVVWLSTGRLSLTKSVHRERMF